MEKLIPRNVILEGDVMKRLRELPDKSVNCVITSPPYYGLRDYGHKDQLGFEKTSDHFIRKMVKIFREVRRVLKNNGTLWINIGDSYCASTSASKNQSSSTLQGSKRRQIDALKRLNKKPSGKIKPKDMMCIPWKLGLALQADGWWLRQDIIWNKPNPMPESVGDRCTKAHEYILLLSKSKKYYFDAFAISTPVSEKTISTYGYVSGKAKADGSGLIQSEAWAKSVKLRKPKVWTGESVKGYDHREQGDKKLRNHSGNFDAEGNMIGGGRANKRSVWTIATKPYKQAHFATFPEKLVEDCIKAGCPENGIVLDPFIGAGTTALVARKLNRNFIGIELVPKYVKMAVARLKKELGLFI